MTSRRRLCRWGGWFTLAHAGFLILIELRYLWYYSRLAPSIGWVYAVMAFLGHMGTLACVPIFAVLPIMLLAPRWTRLIVPVAVLLASAEAALLLLDASVFAEERSHLNILTFALPEPRTGTALTFYLVGALVIEALLARGVWRRTATASGSRAGACLAVILAGCFLASHLVHAWAEAHSYVPVTAFTRFLPLYFPLQDSRRMERLGLVSEARTREFRRVAAMGRLADGGLRYPLALLHCDPPSPGLNVLLVVIDGMRADALSPGLTPALSQFGKGAVRFDAHYSGGMGSRAGMFSLFYCLLQPPRHLLGQLRRRRPASRAHGALQTVRVPARALLQRAGDPVGGRTRPDGTGPRTDLARGNDFALSEIERPRSHPDQRVVRLAGATRSVTPVLRIPVLRRRGGLRASRRLSLGGGGPPRRAGPGRQARPLSHRPALHRRSPPRGARRPRAAGPRGAHSGDRHLRPRDGVRRERPRLHRPQHGVQ